ncbi:MAG TPA: TadE/TadG family type IV pilus assembly protein [Abditibacterium sp.]
MTSYRYFLRAQSASRRGRRRGAALIEFALIASIFFTMLLGLIQFGIYQSTSNSLWNLSREGARFASVGMPTTAQIESHVREVAPPNIKSEDLTVVTTPDPRLSGQSVTVTLTYDMDDKIIFPELGPLFKKTYTTVSTMRVE